MCCGWVVIDRELMVCITMDHGALSAYWREHNSYFLAPFILQWSLAHSEYVFGTF
jgi:hypothetical protein